MKKEIKLICEDGRIIETQRGITVAELLKLVNEDGQVIALRINGVASATNMEIMNDAYVKYIRVSDRIGRKIYTKGLQYMYILAIKELYGDNVVVNIKHSIDKGIYTEIKMRRPIDNSVVKAIKNKMKDLVAADLPIKKVSVSRDDAIEYVKSQDENEKILNYTYMTSDYVTMYELEDMYNYFYYVMPVSTKMLNRFDLTFVAPNGIVLSYPIDNTVPKYESIPKVLDAFKNYETKISSLGVKYAGELNKIITKGEISDFIHTNELFYDESLDEIATKVKNNKNIKSIFISGPSSSGKTTTSKKLALFLKSKGIDALVLSTDDYFVERKDSPRREDGSYEFEIVEALDIKLFNMHMKSLLSGKEVIIPTYNFITGEKEYKRKPISLKNIRY
jgi:uridine kinase